MSSIRRRGPDGVDISPAETIDGSGSEHGRWNYWTMALYLSCYRVGLVLVQTDTVLPVLMLNLTTNPLLLGLASSLYLFFWTFPQSLSAFYTRRLREMKPLVSLLGIPATDQAFYPSILGAVLIGIGIALLVERFKEHTHMIGLGLGGAISINTAGACGLIIWLLWGDLAMPLQGTVFLWLIVILLLGISGLELLADKKKRSSIDSARVH